MREQVTDKGVGYFHEASAGLRFGIRFHLENGDELLVERMTLAGNAREDACQIVERFVQDNGHMLKQLGLTRIAYDPTSHPKTTELLAPQAINRALEWAARQCAKETR